MSGQPPSRDMYTQLLGLPPGPRPPDHYALLGLPRFTDDAEAIDSAVHRRMEQLDEISLHRDSAIRRQVHDLMTRVAQARVCLVDAKAKAEYDRQLRAEDERPTVDIGPRWSRRKTIVLAVAGGGALLACVAAVVIFVTAHLLSQLRISQGPGPAPLTSQPKPVVIVQATRPTPATVAATPPLTTSTAPAVIATTAVPPAAEPASDWARIDPALTAETILWANKETVGDYAKRVGLRRTTFTLELGGGANLKTTLLPAGTYLIGPDQATGRPKQQGYITVGTPLFLSGLITQEQYRQVMGDVPHPRPGTDVPVANITPADAARFCERVSLITGRTARPVDEADLDFACRVCFRGTELAPKGEGFRIAVDLIDGPRFPTIRPPEVASTPAQTKPALEGNPLETAKTPDHATAVPGTAASGPSTPPAPFELPAGAVTVDVRKIGRDVTNPFTTITDELDIPKLKRLGVDIVALSKLKAVFVDDAQLGQHPLAKGEWLVNRQADVVLVLGGQARVEGGVYSEGPLLAIDTCVLLGTVAGKKLVWLAEHSFMLHTIGDGADPRRPYITGSPCISSQKIIRPLPGSVIRVDFGWPRPDEYDKLAPLTVSAPGGAKFAVNDIPPDWKRVDLLSPRSISKPTPNPFSNVTAEGKAKFKKIGIDIDKLATLPAIEVSGTYNARLGPKNAFVNDRADVIVVVHEYFFADGGLYSAGPVVFRGSPFALRVLCKSLVWFPEADQLPIADPVGYPLVLGTQTHYFDPPPKNYVRGDFGWRPPEHGAAIIPLKPGGADTATRPGAGGATGGDGAANPPAGPAKAQLPDQPAVLGPNDIPADVETVDALKIGKEVPNPFTNITEQGKAKLKELGADIEKLSKLRAVQVEVTALLVHDHIERGGRSTLSLVNRQPAVILVLSGSGFALSGGVYSAGPLLVTGRVRVDGNVVGKSLVWFVDDSWASLALLRPPPARSERPRVQFDAKLSGSPFIVSSSRSTRGLPANVVTGDFGWQPPRPDKTSLKLAPPGGAKIDQTDLLTVARATDVVAIGKPIVNPLKNITDEGRVKLKKLGIDVDKMAGLKTLLLAGTFYGAQKRDFVNQRTDVLLVIGGEFGSHGGVYSAGPVVVTGGMAAEVVSKNCLWLVENARPAAFRTTGYPVLIDAKIRVATMPDNAIQDDFGWRPAAN